jgi:WXG100 family type VII secretion target
MPDLQVAIPSMNQAYQAFVQAEADCTTHKNKVTTTVTGLVGTGWTGEASLKFGQVMEQWNVSFQKIIDALNGLEVNFQNNIKKYEAQEEANRAVASSSGAAG